MVYRSIALTSLLLAIAIALPPTIPDISGYNAPSQTVAETISLRFSTMYGEGMVMQSAPSRAVVWGFCGLKDSVSLLFNGDAYTATITPRGNFSTWSVKLPPQAASFKPHTLTAQSSSNEHVSIKYVMFGDVWVCSGQSNMAYGISGSNGTWLAHPPVNNSEAEGADMVNYPYVRLYRVGEASKSSPQLEVRGSNGGGSYPPIDGWSKPCPRGAASCRVDFSSVCYFFGRNIFAALAAKNMARPIGLIGSYVGGTPDEVWSSPDALAECLDPSQPVPSTDSGLWNGMIVPMLNTTIKGVVWYQGEANKYNPGGRHGGYKCTFPAMIADWRAKWNQGTDGETDPQFPFGFVQLNSANNGDVYQNPKDPNNVYSPIFGFAGLRWSQTAGYGYVPNPVQPNVFMAVALDTPDLPYPTVRGDLGYNVHSPFKQPVGARLARSGLAMAYGFKVDTVGPLPGKVAHGPDNQLILQITGLGPESSGVQIKSKLGFEVLSDGIWVNTSVVSHTKTTVVIGNIPKGGTKLRYLWYDNPCGKYCFGCAVYIDVVPIGNLTGELPFLPLPPFTMDIPSPVGDSLPPISIYRHKHEEDVISQ